VHTMLRREERRARGDRLEKKKSKRRMEPLGFPPS
jgi:hypothetical protein